MDPTDINPIEYFNTWFEKSINVDRYNVEGVIEALGRHVSSADPTAQDYVMPLRRCREREGRFRIYGENQDTFYCFVYAGDELKIDPPVYFESCLNLAMDYGIDTSLIIDGDHTLVAERFTDFVWLMLGHHICLRNESGNQFKSGVTGILFDGIKLDDAFVNPLNRDFPAGYEPYFSDGIICIPDWGAAFRTPESRERFLCQYTPSVSGEWA